MPHDWRDELFGGEMTTTTAAWLRKRATSAPYRAHQTHSYLLASVLSLFLGFTLLHSIEASAETLLTIRTAQQTLDISRQQIEALPQHRVHTSTSWTDGVKDFEGPLMRDVLALLNAPIAETASLKLIAWNEYEVDVSMKDYLQWDVILAHHMDGKALTRTDQGPLWVVYPRDQVPALQESRIDYRWAWMLRHIVVAP